VLIYSAVLYSVESVCHAPQDIMAPDAGKQLKIQTETLPSIDSCVGFSYSG
jgi:hypothetical protein